MGKFWEIKNAADSGKTPELWVYGDIGEWLDVDSRDFVQQIRSIDGPAIDVRINSNGGSVTTAQAIYSLLKSHGATITVYIDGIAASAASIITMAGDEVIMPSNAMLMIHNPATIAWGDSADMRKVADVLDKFRDTIIEVYTNKSGMARDDLIKLMDQETWLTAREAHALGFVDTIASDLKIAASVKGDNYFINGVKMDGDRMPKKWFNSQRKEPETMNIDELKAKFPDVYNAAVNAGVTQAAANSKPVTLESLKAEHADVYNAAVNVGVTQERERIKAIEDMAITGHDAITTNAKFVTGITAEAFAVEIVKAEKVAKSEYLKNRKDDAGALNGLGTSTPVPTADADKAARAAVVASVSAAFTGRNTSK